MSTTFHIDVNCSQKNYGEERICGDVFLSRKIKEEDRTIVVLSDGMGHGVKANVLATLTSTMALNFTSEHKEPEKIAEMIMNTLPICSERKMSYSTFTIVDIEPDGKVTILEYDNPQTIIMRKTQAFDPGWTCIVMQSEKNAGKEIKSCSFYPQKEDRIILCTDGISQAGLGTDKYPFGWGMDNMKEYVSRLIENNHRISARRLAGKIVTMAHKIDGYYSRDDTSSAVIYFREPRKLLVCTGPPYEEENDKKLADKVKNFKGRKIISGATTADIIGRELDIEIEDTMNFDDPDLPPLS
ncbi:MAG: SpoIIE family protein phosphatase, partial [Bacteroidota bacterium]